MKSLVLARKDKNAAACTYDAREDSVLVFFLQLLDGNDKPFNNQVNFVNFYSLVATAGTMYLDNVKLYGTNDTCNEAVGKK